MKPASDAKKQSKDAVDQTTLLTNTLMSYFEEKVAEATKLGKFNIDSVKLMESQAPPQVLTAVEAKLKALGYRFSHSFHNASKAITVNLSWN